ncbi:MAG: phosphatidate cytidylyltransferase [Rikenellaceae bacterium]|nr:phosphatidate cytidylyltransferase [Rikenellaceae bacterium]MBP3612251.1 phosphatidate cytidylyltransferase [Rikenellaceae bacterium]MBR4055086.1 phosphatidate cytidylyltransferase [Rikenellaceae bacterium]
MMNPKIKDILIRAASGVVMLVVMLTAMLWSTWSFAALLVAITAGVTWEHLRLSEHCGAQPQKVMAMGIALLVVAPFALLFDSEHAITEGVSLMFGMMFVVMIAMLMVLFVELFRQRETPIQNVGATILPALQVALPIAMLALLPALGEGYNAWRVVAFFSIIWANDVFAFLVGITLGRHRLCERISPKKSWEGFIGGIVAAMGVALLAAHLLGENMTVWAGLGLVSALAAVAGDLVESMFKRAAGVKDSGAIMPGHGGWFDRFDAVLMAAPVAVIYRLMIEIL